MKQIFLGLIIVLGTYSINAQKDSTNITSIKSSNKNLGKKPHLDMLLVDLNWDYLIGLQNPVRQKWYGRGIAVSLMYDYPIKSNGQISFAIGGGFCSHNYYTNALIKKSGTSELADFQIQPSSIKERGKVSVNYVDVPFEFRFRTLEDDREHRWKLAVGGRVGYLLNVHETIKDVNGFKTKLYFYPHVSKFRYGPTVRFGYGAVMLTGFYSLSTFFQTGKSVDTHNALSIGLTISPF